MVRRQPKNLSPAAKAKVEFLAGWREFNVGDVKQAKEVIQESKIAERKLAEWRQSYKRKNSIAAKNVSSKQTGILARSLKDTRRQLFDRMIEIKGDKRDPFLTNKGEITRGKYARSSSDELDKMNGSFYLRHAHQEKLKAIRAQKKPNLP